MNLRAIWLDLQLRRARFFEFSFLIYWKMFLRISHDICKSIQITGTVL